MTDCFRDEQLVSTIKNGLPAQAGPPAQAGGLAVIPTDTLYGIVASAHDPKAVERLYHCKGRDTSKPCVILVSDPEEIDQFVGEITPPVEAALDRLWPGAVSVIMPVSDSTYEYLHRGTETLAFRCPDWLELRAFLRKTGPLVAPSANPQGAVPAETISAAKAYFGNNVDYYCDNGTQSGRASTLIRLTENGFVIEREGSEADRVRRKLQSQ